ncbi:GAF domain-containing protein [Candidatus Symbiobacter mobilis]|uniref:Bacteriophytochrome n=1 Tax=Candidatus Symbiobacter mobilis CR TaxID=946483 RepID=U5NAU0_9BURK|nr:GAF domain-containing protein [Candidatus Symbiobacter mobilis]AGX88691.1 bacteriophytochrome [Candidatus Symbiobacter mobilis CR]
MTDMILIEKMLRGCEAEKLHLSGAIQPFGALLCLQSEGGTISHASANLAEFLSLDPQAVIGRTLDQVVPSLSRAISVLATTPGETAVVRNVMQNAQGHIDALLIRGEDFVVVELEYNTPPAEPIPVQHLQQPFLSAPQSAEDCDRYHQHLVESFRKVIGYDRIMMYRFTPDWSGEVVAEATAPGVGSYMGLRFPASDIPAIARNIYMLNPARMIPDTQAMPVPVLGSEERVPDLTRSDVRSVSPVHLEYLANMGVRASFSVPIRIAGRLWGLVACHHRTPLPLTPDHRNACVMLASTYTLGLSTYISSHRLKVIDSLDRKIDAVLEKLGTYTDPLDGIEINGQALLDTVGANGFAMAIKEDVVINGDGPGVDGLSVIDDWFVNHCNELVLSSDHLSDLFPDRPEVLHAASGMLAIKAQSPRSGWVRFYWFREAEPQHVAWAGNPNKPMIENAGAMALSPRRSFERWVEIKSDYSRPWSREEQIVAAKFRNNLLRWL